MELYTYEKEIQFGDKSVYAVFGIKQCKGTEFIDKFSYICEWFSIGALFYLNSAYIHSRLFSLFVFIVGMFLIFTLNKGKKVSTKEEFLEKVNEILNTESEVKK